MSIAGWWTICRRHWLQSRRRSAHRISPRAGQLRYRVEPTERGDWETGWLYVRYRSGLGLAERWATAPLTQTVRVYPALRTGEEQQIFLARSRQIDLQLRRAQQRGLGRDFESLREYREGDDLRDICWTATARRGSPITRQYQTERSQPVWIVLDCGRLMRSRVAVGSQELQNCQSRRQAPSHSKLDHACTTAVALAQLALYSGDRVGLLAYGQSIQQRLLPGRGAAHLRQLIESLAQVHAEAGEADHLRATATLNRLQPRRSLILWVTDLAETAMRPEVIDGALQLLRRHVLLFVAMAQPEVESIAQARPKECRADVPRRRRPGDGRPPRTAPRPPPRAGRADPRPEPRSAHLVGAESVPDGEGTGDGVANLCNFSPSTESRPPVASSEKIVIVNRSIQFVSQLGDGAGVSCTAGSLWCGRVLLCAQAPNPTSATNPFFGSVTVRPTSDETLKLSLDDAVRRGLENNLGLKEAENGEKVDHRAKRNEALQEFLPTITLSGDTGVHQHNLVALGFGPSALKEFSSLFPGGMLPAGLSFITRDELTEGQIHLARRFFPAL